jgi:hypothetical protein
MAVREVHLQQVLGAVVWDRKGRRVGRLEEYARKLMGPISRLLSGILAAMPLSSDWRPGVSGALS